MAYAMTANPVASGLWFPGKKMEGFVVAPLSARALEIAKSREELLGLLRDIPECELELSLTDLVEKEPVAAAGDDVAANLREDHERKKTAVVKERRKRRSSSRSSLGSSSDGVLLNFYLPASLTRTLTAPRSSSKPLSSSSSAAADGSKRDSNLKSPGCWPALWERRRGQSRRQKLQK
ncbi:hypothetical protein Cni_G15016 [Canna indica]|uniref:Uncharacterized protein n=1 Tax=Canna indica TaxID=4628 RepID=A0AAQ3QCX1_9LILI|nr:hypothetical protein Cni_G15016 [Canna indica]